MVVSRPLPKPANRTCSSTQVIGLLFAEEHGLAVICVRLGHVPMPPQTEYDLDAYQARPLSASEEEDEEEDDEEDEKGWH